MLLQLLQFITTLLAIPTEEIFLASKTLIPKAPIVKLYEAEQYLGIPRYVIMSERIHPYG